MLFIRNGHTVRHTSRLPRHSTHFPSTSDCYAGAHAAHYSHTREMARFQPKTAHGKLNALTICESERVTTRQRDGLSCGK